MRNFKQYFFKNKFHIFSFFFKFRILNFKRPKWFKIKNQIFYYIKQLFFLKKKVGQHSKLRFIKNLMFIKKFFYNKFKIKKNTTITFLIRKLNKKYLLIQKKIKSKEIKKIKINIFFFKFIKKLKKFIFSKKFFLLKNQFFFLKNYKKKKKNFFFIRNKRKFLRKFFFLKVCILRKNPKFSIHKRYFFKNLLTMKSTVIKYFFGYFTLKFFKKQLNKLKVSSYNTTISSIFINFEYHLDILLYRLKFFVSPYLAKFARKNNFISSKIPKLKNSTFISLNLKFNYKYNLRYFVKSFFLSSVYEIDYYTGTIFLVKNLESLDSRDVTSILKEPICVYKFKDYLQK